MDYGGNIDAVEIEISDLPIKVSSWPGPVLLHLDDSVIARADVSPDRCRRSMSVSCATGHALIAPIADRNRHTADVDGRVSTFRTISSLQTFASAKRSTTHEPLRTICPFEDSVLFAQQTSALPSPAIHASASLCRCGVRHRLRPLSPRSGHRTRRRIGRHPGVRSIGECPGSSGRLAVCSSQSRKAVELKHSLFSPLLTPYFGNINWTCARICQSAPKSGVTAL
jgi:hypothetical protein